MMLYLMYAQQMPDTQPDITCIKQKVNENKKTRGAVRQVLISGRGRKAFNMIH